MDLNIELTELAAKKIIEIRAAEKIADTELLRIGIIGGGCHGFSFNLGFDAKKDNDIAIVVREITIIVDPISAMYLDGISLDYVDGLMGSGFKFAGGQVKSTCGCGSSVAF